MRFLPSGPHYTALLDLPDESIRWAGSMLLTLRHAPGYSDLVDAAVRHLYPVRPDRLMRAVEEALRAETTPGMTSLTTSGNASTGAVLDPLLTADDTAMLAYAASGEYTRHATYMIEPITGGGGATARLTRLSRLDL